MKNKRITILCAILVLVSGCDTAKENQTTSDHSTTTKDVDKGESKANADVIFVKAVKENKKWTFYVTVSHPDTGWEDYADGWNIITPEGKIIKTDKTDKFTRTLMHPHVDEQPFTRSQTGIRLPENTTYVTVKAHDIVDGFGGKEIKADFTKEDKNSYEIIYDT